jgi:hypothetical protein
MMMLTISGYAGASGLHKLDGPAVRQVWPARGGQDGLYGPRRDTLQAGQGRPGSKRAGPRTQLVFPPPARPSRRLSGQLIMYASLHPPVRYDRSDEWSSRQSNTSFLLLESQCSDEHEPRQEFEATSVVADKSQPRCTRARRPARGGERKCVCVHI